MTSQLPQMNYEEMRDVLSNIREQIGDVVAADIEAVLCEHRLTLPQMEHALSDSLPSVISLPALPLDATETLLQS